MAYKSRVSGIIIICIFMASFTHFAFGQNAMNSPVSDRMDWWKNAKFGMFIHWGVYAVPAGTYNGRQVPFIGEWIMHRAKIPVAEYKTFAKQFNPVKYDPDAWVRMAKDAGMKYIVITSKHHDGFALYDSKVTDWDIADATPYKKDLLKPLVAACRKHGIKIGFYYSQAQDWNHPGGAAGGGHWDKAQDGDMDEYLEKIAIKQVEEILSNYGDIDVLWWDTPEGMTPERAARLHKVASKYPRLVTNNRLGGGYKGDTETPEQYVPATGFPGRNWETCMTMNDTWGYKSYDHNWKSSTTLIRTLVDIVSKGGNFLLNVGPTSEGVIPGASIARLDTVGKWLKTNSESIYSTTASPFPFLSWGCVTRKNQKLYLHVLDYPADGELHLPMSNKITKAYMLAKPSQQLSVRPGKGRSTIRLPKNAPDKIDCVVAIEFTSEPDVLPLPMKNAAITVSSRRSDKDLPGNIVDLDAHTRWTAAKGERKASVEAELETPAAIATLLLNFPERSLNQQVELQYLQDNNWVPIAKINATGSTHYEKFKTVTAKRFRLIIENKEAEPTLVDWQLYRPE